MSEPRHPRIGHRTGRAPAPDCSIVEAGSPDLTKPAIRKKPAAAAPTGRHALAYERRHEPLAPRATFFRRITVNLGIALGLVALSLFAGMLGYHYLGGLAWIDAFLNAAMILSGMGPVDVLTAAPAKLFAGLYAIYSGLTLVATAGLVLAPIIHRFLHRFHLEDESDQG